MEVVEGRGEVEVVLVVEDMLVVVGEAWNRNCGYEELI